MKKLRYLLVLTVLLFTISFQSKAEAFKTENFENYELVPRITYTEELTPRADYTAHNSDSLLKSVADALRNNRTNFSILYAGSDAISVYNSLEALIYDEPNELFDYYVYMADSKWTLSSYGSTNTFILEFYNFIHSPQEEKLINEFVERTISEMGLQGLSDYEKIKRVHDKIILMTDYDVSYNSPYDILESGRGVCQSYAMLYSKFMENLNIPVRIVRGQTTDRNIIPHSWNLVMLDGKWYNVDLTWDDPIHYYPTPNSKNFVSYEYFLVPNSSMPYHEPLVGFPVATSSYNTGLPKEKFYTQDEINVLLNGLDVPGTEPTPFVPEPVNMPSEMVSYINSNAKLPVNHMTGITKNDPMYTWTVSFNQELNPATVENSVKIYNDRHERVLTVTASIDPTNKTKVKLRNSQSYEKNSLYYILIDGNASSSSGGVLKNATAFPFIIKD